MQNLEFADNVYQASKLQILKMGKYKYKNGENCKQKEL